MSILVVCNDPARDPGIGLVGDALARRGVELRTFRADHFPVDARLTAELDEGGRASILEGVSCVWLRHADCGGAVPEHIREDIAVAIRQQAQTALHTVLNGADIPVYDPPDAIALAPEKPRQLALARSLGMRTPRSLLTNDVAALRRFTESCKTGVIAKMVESVRVHATVDGAEVGGLTRAITDADLENEEALALCPMLFQERVLKVRDLRVTVVGQRLFTAAVRAGDTLDWRGDRALIEGFVPAELPAALEAAVLAYCDRIGVQFAGFDFVEDAAGTLTFIEANTTSYFHFVEQATRQPISEAIADLLQGVAVSRRTPWTKP